MKQAINQATSQPINPSTNQPTNPPTNHPTNQPTHQPKRIEKVSKMVPKMYRNDDQTVEKDVQRGAGGPRGGQYGPNGVQTRKNLEKVTEKHRKVRPKGPSWGSKWRPKTVKCRKSDEKRLPEERLEGEPKKNRKMGPSCKSPPAFRLRRRSRNTVFKIAREAANSIKKDLQNCRFRHPLAPLGGRFDEK